jgi:hypothetical protein
MDEDCAAADERFAIFGEIRRQVRHDLRQSL